MWFVTCFSDLGHRRNFKHPQQKTYQCLRPSKQTLGIELGVYKRAYADLDFERRQSERLKQEADKQCEDLEDQLKVAMPLVAPFFVFPDCFKGHRIVILLDGDGAAHLISQGQAGGHAAACVSSDSIIQYVSSLCGANRYQLWVYMFLIKVAAWTLWVAWDSDWQKPGLMTLWLVSTRQWSVTVIDTGNGKEAAEAKIKGIFFPSFPHSLPMFLQISGIARS